MANARPGPDGLDTHPCFSTRESGENPGHVLLSAPGTKVCGGGQFRSCDCGGDPLLRKQVTGGCNGLAGKAADLRWWEVSRRNTSVRRPTKSFPRSFGVALIKMPVFGTAAACGGPVLQRRAEADVDQRSLFLFRCFCLDGRIPGNHPHALRYPGGVIPLAPEASPSSGAGQWDCPHF